MTPVEFLTVQLDELEDVAKRAAFGWGAEWRTETIEEEDWSVVHADGKRAMVGCEDGDVTRHIAANDPLYVLADIAAKRAIIEYVGTAIGSWSDLPLGSRRGFGRVLQFLVQPFADHPDFDESWRL